MRNIEWILNKVCVCYYIRDIDADLTNNFHWQLKPIISCTVISRTSIPKSRRKDSKLFAKMSFVIDCFTLKSWMFILNRAFIQSNYILYVVYSWYKLIGIRIGAVPHREFIKRKYSTSLYAKQWIIIFTVEKDKSKFFTCALAGNTSQW